MSDLPLFSPDGRLEELEAEKVRLFEELAEVAEKQRALSKEVLAVEREQKWALRDVEEYVVPEDRGLALEDVERWLRSVHLTFAKTMADIPHMYAARKRCDDRMFSRVIEFVRTNGYSQRYGRRDYTVLDVDLRSGRFFCWASDGPPAEVPVINVKPDSLRPE